MESNTDAAMEDALRLLARSQKSIYELKRFLEGKGHKEGEIAETVTRLKSLNYLDDFKYALDWGRGRIRRHPIGMRFMRLELEKRGIEREIIGNVLRIIYQENNEKEMASTLLSQKLQRRPGSSHRKIPWVIGLLERRGFSQEVIQEAIEKISNEYYEEGH